MQRFTRHKGQAFAVPCGHCGQRIGRDDPRWLASDTGLFYCAKCTWAVRRVQIALVVASVLWIAALSTALFVLVSMQSARAATLTLSGGQSVMNSLSDTHGTAYQLSVRGYSGHALGASTGLVGGYLNLGHQGRHKIDGLFGLYQIRWRYGALSTFAGIGPYLSADTVPVPGGYRDRYGVDCMTQFGAAYRIGAWAVSARWERLTSWRNRDEDVFLAGIGRTL